MSTANYPYAEGALLDQPNTYFYSAYGGAAFLDAWRSHRELTLAGLPPASVAPSAQPPATSPVPGERLETALLLEFLVAGLMSDRDPARASTRPWLDKLIQRFEVTKRIHAAYDARFRPESNDAFRDLELYVRFGEVLVVACQAGCGLPALNALLKLNDTLVALRDRLDARSQARLARLILSERALVQSLTNKSKLAT
jgi:hypothetical protein